MLRTRSVAATYVSGLMAGVMVLAGCEGDAGINTLINLADEPVGLNCQYGGTKIQAGPDDNRDGVLTAEEITQTSYVCRARVDGDSSLITAVAEPAGANCAQGGIRVQVGLDDNDDRVLQPGEVDATTYVCDGLSRLMNLVVLPAGSACETGGVRVESGWDTNDNGSLQMNEVDTSVNVCNGRASLTNVVAVPEGTAPCADGGIRVQNGFDLNGNNQLDGNEVNNTQFVCNGADGFNTLVRTDAEPAGIPCVFGGTRIKSGLDINKNNVLDASEVLNSFPVCAVQVNSNLTLVRNSAIVPGPVCQYGGVKTEVGYDSNNNLVLDPAEILPANGGSTTNNCNSVIILDGLNSLVSTAPATSGQCPFGGFIFRSGLDANRNNVLETAEISQTQVVCNGANGFNTVVSQTYLPVPSVDCGNDGGVSVKSGLDLNRNGQLETGEVQATASVCNGLPGLNSLIRMSDAGTACGIFGGVRVQVGVDDNENNVLDASEVENTDYVCNGHDGWASLIEPRDAGMACGIYGGQKYVVGWDEDFDGILDTNEIVPSLTSYVCNGADGYTTLVDVTEGDWSQCPAYGIRLEVGLDTNSNGILDFSEIDFTNYVCDGVDGV